MVRQDAAILMLKSLNLYARETLKNEFRSANTYEHIFGCGKNVFSEKQLVVIDKRIDKASNEQIAKCFPDVDVED